MTGAVSTTEVWRSLSRVYSTWQWDRMQMASADRSLQAGIVLPP